MNYSTSDDPLNDQFPSSDPDFTPDEPFDAPFSDDPLPDVTYDAHETHDTEEDPLQLANKDHGFSCVTGDVEFSCVTGNGVREFEAWAAQFDRATREALAGAVSDAVPTQAGERYWQNGMFRLARMLKAVPLLRDASDDAAYYAVAAWWERSRFAGGGDWELDWLRFGEMWNRVVVPAGEAQLPSILERARANVGPLLRRSERYTLLVSLCRELQRAFGDRPFFLGCRTAAEVLGLPGTNAYITASRMLRLARDDGLIELVSVGSMKSGDASKYRYIGSDL